MHSHPIAKILLAFLNLAKARILVMVLVACSIGFLLALHGRLPVARFLWTLFGTGLLSGGAAALNCYVERDADALMQRTCKRPIPSGLISPGVALAFALLQVTTGAYVLFAQTNVLAACLGLTAVFIYVAIYTPAKRMSWINTPIGALPGAIPPLIGWASASGQIGSGGWVLFFMLFFWQHVHFFPIAWLHRIDYQKAGFRMLPAQDADGNKTFLCTVLAAVALLLVSLLLRGATSAGTTYSIAAVVLGLLLISAGVRLSQRPSKATAHAILFLCLVYLPVVLATVVIDRSASAGFTRLQD